MKKSRKLLQMSAEWCSPCRRIKTLIKEKYSDKLDYYDVLDADDPEIRAKYDPQSKLRSIPTMIIYDEVNEEEVERFHGGDTNKIDEFFNSINEEDEKG